MAFWESVDAELEYKCMTRKSLADKVGISLASIGQGIKLGSSPSADTAVRIAKVLGVTVEYLVTGSDSEKTKDDQKKINEDLESFRRYRGLVDKIKKLSPQGQEAVSSLVEKMQGL